MRYPQGVGFLLSTYQSRVVVDVRGLWGYSSMQPQWCVWLTQGVLYTLVARFNSLTGDLGCVAQRQRQGT